MSWIMLTLVTTTNTQIHTNYVHLTSPQQCVKYTNFSKSKFRSYDPWKQIPEYTHFSFHSYFLMCTIHTYIIHKLFINLCNCRTIQCFTTQPCVKYTDFFKSKFGSYDPPEINSWTYSHSHHSYFLIRTIHTYINHKLFINSCNYCTTQCVCASAWVTRALNYAVLFLRF